MKRRPGPPWRRIALLLIPLAALPPTGSAEEAPSNSHALDSATHMRLRMQLVPEVVERPICESDTPVGRKEEMQRAIAVFPEIVNDKETFNAITPKLCLDDERNFSDEDKLRIYRQFENVTSIRLLPLGKDSAGLDTYERTFVPNYQPHCEAEKEPPTIVNAEHGVIVVHGIYATSLPPQPSSQQAAPEVKPPKARPLHHISIPQPCHPAPDPAIQRVEMDSP